MIAHFIICTLGSADLVQLCLHSIRRFGGNCMVDIVDLPADTTDPAAHGYALNQWRQTYDGQVADDDVVVIMDPDCALLSAQWRIEMERAFSAPHVAIWGAGAQEDFGPRVHASMMCIRGSFWNRRWMLNYGFVPCPDAREYKWRDTGGLVCMWAKAIGLTVQPLERGPDWHGASAWWGMKPVPSEAFMPAPLWSHLGGGTHSDVTRLTWWQRQRRRRAIKQRRRWIKAVQTLLSNA